MPSIPHMMNATMNTKFGKWFMGPYSTITPMTVATISCLTKDGVNCAFYTWQAWTNKRIPEDKRGFIGALDLANGILNIGIQLSVAIGLSKLTDKVYDKFIGNKLKKELPQKIFNKYKDTKNALSKVASQECAEGLIKAGKNGLGVIVTLVALQVICKRIIVPSLATPFASFLRDKVDTNHGKNKKQQVLNKSGDTVSFENRNVTVSNSVQENKKLPDCFNSFMK